MNEAQTARKPNLRRGIILVALGVYFLLRNYGVFHSEVNWDKIWPLFLIGAGILAVFFPRERRFWR